MNSQAQCGVGCKSGLDSFLAVGDGTLLVAFLPGSKVFLLVGKYSYSKAFVGWLICQMGISQ